MEIFSLDQQYERCLLKLQRQLPVTDYSFDLTKKHDKRKILAASPFQGRPYSSQSKSEARKTQKVKKATSKQCFSNVVIRQVTEKSPPKSSFDHILEKLDSQAQKIIDSVVKLKRKRNHQQLLNVSTFNSQKIQMLDHNTESKDTTQLLARPKTRCENNYCSIRNNKVKQQKCLQQIQPNNVRNMLRENIKKHLEHAKQTRNERPFSQQDSRHHPKFVKNKPNQTFKSDYFAVRPDLKNDQQRNSCELRRSCTSLAKSQDLTKSQTQLKKFVDSNGQIVLNKRQKEQDKPLAQLPDFLYAETAIHQVRQLKQRYCHHEDISRMLFNIEDFLVRTMRDPQLGVTTFYQEPRLLTAQDDEQLQDMGLIPQGVKSLSAYLRQLSDMQ